MILKKKHSKGVLGSSVIFKLQVYPVTWYTLPTFQPNEARIRIFSNRRKRSCWFSFRQVVSSPSSPPLIPVGPLSCPCAAPELEFKHSERGGSWRLVLMGTGLLVCLRRCSSNTHTRTHPRKHTEPRLLVKRHESEW